MLRNVPVRIVVGRAHRRGAPNATERYDGSWRVPLLTEGGRACVYRVEAPSKDGLCGSKIPSFARAVAVVKCTLRRGE